MSKNLKPEDFIASYPNIFKKGMPRSGFYSGPGWNIILDTLCPILEHHVLSLPQELQADIYVVQVKEKFGGLRFYMNQSTPYMDGAISMAENLSYSICEQCGAPGTRGGSGYVQTLCAKHRKAKDKKK